MSKQINSVLYYPSWNPSVTWFRTMLLFYDQVQVILPADVEDPEYRVANKKVIDLIPTAFREIRRQRYEMTVDVKAREIFLKRLNEIARRTVNGSRLAITLSKGKYEFSGYRYVHSSKLSGFVMAALREHGLISDECREIASKLSNVDDFYVVERRASDLLLAYIAEFYARASDIRTATDSAVGYVPMLINRNAVSRSDAAMAYLASTTMKMTVPASIDRLSPEAFVELRKRYTDIREPFQNAMMVSCNASRLAGAETASEFIRRTQAASKDFCRQLATASRRKWWQDITKWSVFSIGSAAAVASLGEPELQKIGVGLEIAVSFYLMNASPTLQTPTDASQQLLSTLQGELKHPWLRRRLRSAGLRQTD